MSRLPENVHEETALHGRSHVFNDRQEAGVALAKLLVRYRATEVIILGIPAGGVPVAAAAARELSLPFDFITVSKILLPWNTEAGYGAVACDGSWQLNDRLVHQAGLDSRTVQDGIASTKEKVERRTREFRKLLTKCEVKNKVAIIVDNGLASGFTMRVAVAALKNRDVRSVAVAVPTGHINALIRLASDVDEIYCANIRAGKYFAVAEAYAHWSDVGEDEVTSILGEFQLQRQQSTLSQ